MDCGNSSYYPNIIIAGFPKCGTSFLWTTLISHPSIKLAHKDKEYCGNSFTQPRGDGYLTINACINPTVAIQRHNCFNRPEKTMFILSVRNPADYSWAAYNYWTNPQDVNENLPERWATPEKNYRSAQLFHEYIVAGTMIKGGFHYPHVVNGFINSIQNFQDTKFIVVNQNTLKHELNRIAKFLKISNEFKHTAFRVNTGYITKARGVDKIDWTQHEIGIYEISRFTPMLETTRRYILEKEHADCEKFYNLYKLNLCNITV